MAGDAMVGWMLDLIDANGMTGIARRCWISLADVPFSWDLYLDWRMME
jgi:hypothetical protein